MTSGAENIERSHEGLSRTNVVGPVIGQNSVSEHRPVPRYIGAARTNVGAVEGTVVHLPATESAVPVYEATRGVELAPREKEIIVIGAPHGSEDAWNNAYVDQVIDDAVTEVSEHFPDKKVAVSLENVLGTEAFTDAVRFSMEYGLSLSEAINVATIYQALIGGPLSVQLDTDDNVSDKTYQKAAHTVVEKRASSGNIIVHFEEHSPEIAEKLRDPKYAEAWKFVDEEARMIPPGDWDEAYYDRYRKSLLDIAESRDTRDRSDSAAVQKLAGDPAIAKIIVVRGPAHRAGDNLSSSGYNARVTHPERYVASPFTRLIDQVSEHPDIPVTNLQIRLSQLAYIKSEDLPSDATEAEVLEHQNAWIDDMLRRHSELYGNDDKG